MPEEIKSVSQDPAVPQKAAGDGTKKYVIGLIIASAAAILAIGGYFAYVLVVKSPEQAEQKIDMGIGAGGTILGGSRGIMRMETADGEEPALIFVSATTGSETVMVPGAFDDMEGIDYPFASAGKIYFAASPGTNPVVKSVDLFSGKIETLPLDYDADNPVSSFIIKGRNLYYLSGRYCKDYMMECRNMSLKRYNLLTGKIDLLSEGIESGYINGFDETNDKVVMSQGFSDVGCGTWEYQALSLSTGLETNLGSYSDCDPYLTEAMAPFRQLIVGPNNRNFLAVKDGRVVPPDPEFSELNIIGIRIDENEYPKD